MLFALMRWLRFARWLRSNNHLAETGAPVCYKEAIHYLVCSHPKSDFFYFSSFPRLEQEDRIKISVYFLSLLNVSDVVSVLCVKFARASYCL